MEDEQNKNLLALERSLKYLTISFVGIIFGYLTIAFLPKYFEFNQFIGSAGFVIWAVSFLVYIMLSQEFAVVFGRNKGLNFLMTIFFPIGTVWNFLMYRKKIKSYMTNITE